MVNTKGQTAMNGLTKSSLSVAHPVVRPIRGGLSRPLAARSRKAFTLVEVLVVITIIAILASMVTLGVNRAILFSRQVSVKAEMSQLELALANAARDLNNVNFIPSQIILREDMVYDTTSGQEQASLGILRSMFPSLPDPVMLGTAVIDFDGNPANCNRTVLTAEQAYVFFLGGIPSKDDPIGSPALTGPNGFPNPTFGGKQKGPYYDFKPNRLVKRANGFYTYTDAWENSNYSPYVVFNNIGKTVGPTYIDPPFLRTNSNWPGLASEGPFVLNAPNRFLKTGTQFQNPKGYQIISAGKDGKFGGAVSGVFSGYGDAGDGADDQANFADSLLGKPID